MDMIAAARAGSRGLPCNGSSRRVTVPTLTSIGDQSPAEGIGNMARLVIAPEAMTGIEPVDLLRRVVRVNDQRTKVKSPRWLIECVTSIDVTPHGNDHRDGVPLQALRRCLDASRSSICDVAAGEGDGRERRFLFGLRAASSPGRGRGRATPRVRMYTATIVDTRDNRMMQFFHASIARSVDEVRTRLVGRFGPDVAGLADIRQGVHIASPPVLALVPQAVIELIRGMERDCSDPSARHFAVDIEMKIQA